jgi:hypothetical protein
MAMTAAAPTPSACLACRTAVCTLSAPTLIVTLTRPLTALQVSATNVSRSSLDRRRTSESMPYDTVDLLLDHEVDLARQTCEVQVASVVERRREDGQHTGRNVNHHSS